MSAVGLCHQAGGRWPSGPQTCSPHVGAPGLGHWRPDRHRDLPPPVCDPWEPCWLSGAAFLPRPPLQLSSEPVRGRLSLRHPNTHVFRPNWPWGPRCLPLQQGAGAGGTDVQKGKLNPGWLWTAGALGPSLAAWLPRAVTLTPRSSLAGLWCGPHRVQCQASWWRRGQVGDGVKVPPWGEHESLRSVCPVTRPLPRGHTQAPPQGGHCTPSPSHRQPAVPGGPHPENAAPGHRCLGSVCPEPQQGQDKEQSWGHPSPGPTGPAAQRRMESDGRLPHAVRVLTLHLGDPGWESDGKHIPDDRDQSEISIGQKQSLSTSKCHKTPTTCFFIIGTGWLLVVT